MSDQTGERHNVLIATGDLDLASAFTEVYLPGGRFVRLPTELFRQQSGAVPDADAAGVTSVAATEDELAADRREIVIPLIEERLEVGRRTVSTGKVRLQKTVQEFETQLDEPLAVRTFDVERVILNTPVETAPAVRQEGDTTIYPLVEEQLILTKQLILKEEVRVTRRDTERRDTQTVVLRREHMVVERENS